MRKYFTKHPESIGETYTEHFLFATKSGLRLAWSGVCCILHGIFPFVFQTTGSETVSALHEEFRERNQKRDLPR